MVLGSDDMTQQTTELIPGTLGADIQALRAEIRELSAALAASLKQRKKSRPLLEKSISEDAILTAHQLAETLDVGVVTVWRYSQRGMPTLRRGRGLIRYRYGDVLAWLSQKKKRAR